MIAQEAIAAAESILPGAAAPDGEIDPRWQAIIAIGEFIDSEPEAVWSFIWRWGTWPDDDLRMAITTCLLEHLLEHHFDRFIERVEQGAATDKLFADTVSNCWRLGQSEDTVRGARLDRLIRSTRVRPG